jgi:hypothetical protein
VVQTPGVGTSRGQCSQRRPERLNRPPHTVDHMPLRDYGAS